MAQEAQNSVDVQEIQFKQHERWNVFSACDPLRSNVNLLAVSSQGLLFAGNPGAPEFKVVILKNLVEANLESDSKLTARHVQLPDVPNVLAASADGSMLAVNYTLNGSAFLQIYSVPSFVSRDLKTLYTLRISPEHGVCALQVLWNPVLTNSLAIVLSNGSLAMYTLKDGGNYDFHSLDKQQQVRCGSWSPKGKQIVLGFPNGKLQQFKPDLTPAKTIACPTNVHPGPFDTIAVHWLSTFQFVVAFLTQGDGQSPLLYIVNAPKGAATTYINYYDICYSAPGPRQHQISFMHIQQWNLLLVISANGVEVGVLGTKETGDTPTWVQYMLLDEARIEMPLTEAKDETYPIGFALDTSSTHQLIVGERTLPVMPMMHVLSTHGCLISFNFLNLMPNAPDICSPPPPIQDASGMFYELEVSDEAKTATPPTPNPPQNSEMSFSFNPPTVSSSSTPALEKNSNAFFGNTAPAASTASNNTFGSPGFTTTFFTPTQPAGGFGSTNLAATAVTSKASTNAFSGFGGANTFGSANTFGAPGGSAKAAEQGTDVPSTTETAARQSFEVNKPLYTVPPTFTPPAVVSGDQQKSSQHQQKTSAKPQLSFSEIDDIIQQMTAVQVDSFHLELQKVSQHSRSVLTNIGKPDELKSYSKRLHGLQEIIDLASDREFELDVQQLRHSLNESYAMLAECRTKLDMYNNPDNTRLSTISTFDPTNQRQLAKLQSSVVTNKSYLQQLQQEMDTQWSSYQDLVRRNSRNKVQIPYLDCIYQRMSKLKDMVACQRTKLDQIKTKLKQKDIICKSLNDLDDAESMEKTQFTMESLADSILSMSLAPVVDAKRSKLSKQKQNIIRELVCDRTIVHVKPRRPDRVGLKSEVILETKSRTQRKLQEDIASAHLKEVQQYTALVSEIAAAAPKPTATKPIATWNDKTAVNLAAASSSTSMSSGSSLEFGGGGSFLRSINKAASCTSADSLKPCSSVEVTSSSTSLAATPVFSGFGVMTTSQPMPFGQTKSVAMAKTEPSAAVAVPPATIASQPHVPVSFAAKIVSSETDSKSSASTMLATKPATSALDKVTTSSLGQTETPKVFSFGSGVRDGVSSLFGEAGAVGGEGKSSYGVSSSGGSVLFSGLGVAKPSFEFKMDSGFNFGGSGTSSISSTAPTDALTTTTANKPFTFASLPDPKTSVAAAIAASTTKSNNVPSTAATATTKAPPTFSGLGKSIGGEATATTAPAAPSFNFGGAMNLSTTKTANASVTTASPAAAAVSDSSSGSTKGATDAADSILSTLNICKPTSKPAVQTSSELTSSTGNVFGSTTFSFSAAGGASKPLFGTPAGSFSFNNQAGSTSGTSATTASATVATAAATSATVAEATLMSASKGTTAPTETTTTKPAADSSSASSTSFTFSLSNLGISSTTAATSVAPTTAASTSVTTITTTATATTAGTTTPSVFGKANADSGTVASPPSSATPTVTATTAETFATTTSVFGSGAPSLFGGATAASPTAAPLFGQAAAVSSAPTTASSVFGSTTSAATASTTTGNVFGGIPKPDQSVFGSPPATQASGSGLFAAAAAANPLSFSSPGAASGGSLFGGATSSGFGASTGSAGGSGSIFGGAATSPTSPFGATSAGSIFSGAAKPTEGASIFGQSSFGQPAATQSGGTSVFGAGSSQQSGSGFGGSIFGSGPSNGASGGSIFGGGSAAAPAFGQNTTGFGSFSQPATGAVFGSPGGGGPFAAGGASVAQTGFGSPQQSTSPFAKPVFGAPAFGSPPTFGAQPSFGGGATFGSPKGFGSFASPAAAAAPAAGSAFASPTQKNPLFEALGSAETGLSFGNLAQNTNPNAPKPTFGGSSFMNYR